MSEVPRMTLVMPLRRRLEFAANALPSFLLHAARPDHEIVIVLDKCPVQYELDRRPDQFLPPREEHIASDRVDREKVYRWIDDHLDQLGRYGIRVIESHGDSSLWTGGLRSARALNEGVEAASTEWIIGIGDEDLIFMNGFDVALWNALDGRDPMHTVSTPVMVMPRAYGHVPPLTHQWIHDQRLLCKHQLSFPILATQGNMGDCRISYKSMQAFAEIAKQGGVHEERCGDRVMAHWVPMLMHRSLLRSINRWPTDDARAFSYDIGLDDELGKRGVMKRMPLDHFIFHNKHHTFISEAVDAQWEDPAFLRLLDGKPIL